MSKSNTTISFKPIPDTYHKISFKSTLYTQSTSPFGQNIYIAQQQSHWRQKVKYFGRIKHIQDYHQLSPTYSKHAYNELHLVLYLLHLSNTVSVYDITFKSLFDEIFPQNSLHIIYHIHKQYIINKKQYFLINMNKKTIIRYTFVITIKSNYSKFLSIPYVKIIKMNKNFQFSIFFKKRPKYFTFWAIYCYYVIIHILTSKGEVLRTYNTYIFIPYKCYNIYIYIFILN